MRKVDVQSVDERGAGSRRGYALALLTSAYLLNFFDRSIVSVLLDPIKADLHLSDTELGFIAGLGFALLYSVLGVPFARLADARGRRGVIAFGIALWSVMTAVGGLARTGAQLALARTGVGIGEAAGIATSIAMVSDLFDNDERPRALGLLNVGMPLGIFLGIFFGGTVGQSYGWRTVLFVAAIPGLILAGLLRFTVREPLRAAALGPQETVRASLLFLRQRKSYVLCLTGSFFAGFPLNALFVWTPALFGRVHGMHPAEVGTSVGVLLGVVGAAGVFAGGDAVTRYAKADDRWKALQPAAACAVALPFLVGMLLCDSRSLALACLAIGSFLSLSLLGPLFSAYQCVTPPRIRSFATSLHNLIGTIGGLGLGSLAVGILSDRLSPTYGVQAIRFALLLPIGCLIPAAAFYFAAARYIQADAAAIPKS